MDEYILHTLGSAGFGRSVFGYKYILAEFCGIRNNLVVDLYNYINNCEINPDLIIYFIEGISTKRRKMLNLIVCMDILSEKCDNSTILRILSNVRGIKIGRYILNKNVLSIYGLNGTTETDILLRHG